MARRRGGGGANLARRVQSDKKQIHDGGSYISSTGRKNTNCDKRERHLIPKLHRQPKTVVRSIKFAGKTAVEGGGERNATIPTMPSFSKVRVTKEKNTKTAKQRRNRPKRENVWLKSCIKVRIPVKAEMGEDKRKLNQERKGP